jgi:NAD(P)-dependent dehydrogenase (short-subunit alcohol dehydrogenase family)
MTDDFFLRNRSTIAVITGGTQGLGLAIAKRLALEGAPGIVVSGRNAEKAEAAAASVRSLGTDCLFAKANVSNAGDCHDQMLREPILSSAATQHLTSLVSAR